MSDKPTPPIYTLKVNVSKVEQAKPSKVQHKVIIESYNLTLEETIAMQVEVVPALVGWLKGDAP